MLNFVKHAVVAATVLACAAASAGIVTFEGVEPTIYAGTETFVSGGMKGTVLGDPTGFAGAMVNGSDPFNCTITACPIGNASTYYAGLNDGGLSLSLSGGGSFTVKGLDFAFVSPTPTIASAFGRLVARGLSADGMPVERSQEFSGSNGSGNFSFTHWTMEATFSQTWFSSLKVSACLYDGNGACVNPASDQAQFGLDNIEFVPEPGSLALVALSLAGLGYVRRRQSI